MSSNITYVAKTIHYYLLDFEFNEGFEADDKDLFREFFLIIKKLVDSKDKKRYVVSGGKILIIQDINFKSTEKILRGKLLSARLDMFPQLLDLSTDQMEGLDVKETQGIVETTHFLIDYSSIKNKKLGIESNMFGARITDFAYYLEQLGSMTSSLKKLGFNVYAKDELKKFQQRIDRCSEFHIRVHRDFLSKIKQVDGGLATKMNLIQKQFQTEQIELKLKFDYKKRVHTKEMTNFAQKLIGKLIKKKEYTMLFNKLSVKAEDKENDNLLGVFDLLVDKVSSTIRVQREPKHRIIVSIDMFKKMSDEMIKFRKTAK